MDHLTEINYIKSRIRQASRVLELVEFHDDQQHASSVRQQLHDLEKQLARMADIYTPSDNLAVGEVVGEPWVLKEFRRVSIPEWRRILVASAAAGDTGREQYAQWMLRDVLLDPEYEQPAE